MQCRGGVRYQARAVVLTTGTFLRRSCTPAKSRRRAAAAATPPRSGCRRACARSALSSSGSRPARRRDSTAAPSTSRGSSRSPATPSPVPFSFLTDAITQPQLDCHITYTNPAVHDLIRANLHRAPMYSGQIQSTGPRYCPSIEDKVVRFADRESHQIFLEPEGRNTLEYYCNGISTSLPRDVQEAIIPLIPGLENAEIMRYGYAVEYDFAPPTQLLPDARDQAGAATCSSPARSTARPATRKPPPRG